MSPLSVHNQSRRRTSSVDKSNERLRIYTKKKAGSRRYRAEANTDADYADNIALLANTPKQAEYLLRSLDQAAGSIGLYVNVDKMEYICFNKKENFSTLNGGSPKLGGQVHVPQ